MLKARSRHFYFKNSVMNIREWLFYIFQARYHVTRMKLQTIQNISRVVEENFLLVKDDHTIRWREAINESTSMGFFQASIWVYQLRKTGNDFAFSKITTDGYNIHYINGFSLFI